MTTGLQKCNLIFMQLHTYQECSMPHLVSLSNNLNCLAVCTLDGLSPYIYFITYNVFLSN